MTEPEPNAEFEEFSRESDEYFAGGIELDALIVEEEGRPGVEFICFLKNLVGRTC